MSHVILDNSFMKEKIGLLRNKETTAKEFCSHLKTLGHLILYEALKNEEMVSYEIHTPLTQTIAQRFKNKICVVPVIRAGLPMVADMYEFLPEVNILHVGMRRNVEKDTYEMYFENITEQMDDESRIFIMEPMIATGNTMCRILRFMKSIGIDLSRICIINILCSNYGVNNVVKEFPEVDIFSGDMDSIITEKGMVLPGVGDMGDRANGTISKE